MPNKNNIDTKEENMDILHETIDDWLGIEKRTGPARRPRGEEIACGIIGLQAAAKEGSLSNGQLLNETDAKLVQDSCLNMASALYKSRDGKGKFFDGDYGRRALQLLETFATDMNSVGLKMLDGQPAASFTDPTQRVSPENPMTLFGHEIQGPADAFETVNELNDYLTPDAMAYLHTDLVDRSIESQGKALLFVPFASELTQDAADAISQASGGSHEMFCDSAYKYRMQRISEQATHADTIQPSGEQVAKNFLDAYKNAVGNARACEDFFAAAKTVAQASSMAGRLEARSEFVRYYPDATDTIGNDRITLDIAQLQETSLAAVRDMARVSGLDTSDRQESINLFGRDISLQDAGRDALVALQEFARGAQDTALASNMEALKNAEKEETVKARLANATEKAAAERAKDTQLGE